jgi:hypothetical protein
VEFKRKRSIIKLMCCTRQSYDYSGNRGGTMQLEMERFCCLCLRSCSSWGVLVIEFFSAKYTGTPSYTHQNNDTLANYFVSFLPGGTIGHKPAQKLQTVTKLGLWAFCARGNNQFWFIPFFHVTQLSY